MTSAFQGFIRVAVPDNQFHAHHRVFGDAEEGFEAAADADEAVVPVNVGPAGDDDIIEEKQFVAGGASKGANFKFDLVAVSEALQPLQPDFLEVLGKDLTGMFLLGCFHNLKVASAWSIRKARGRNADDIPLGPCCFFPKKRVVVGCKS